MFEKWSKYQAAEVLTGKSENGSRLISDFARDYRQVTGADICPSCHDFESKFKNFIKKIETMKVVKSQNSGFALKAMYNNITLHGSQVYYQNETLTDEQAIELLQNHPRGEGLFDVLPENWKDLKGKPAVTDAVELFGKTVTVEEAKDLFKSAGIETKAITAKGLSDKLKSLTEEEKVKLSNLVNPEQIDVVDPETVGAAPGAPVGDPAVTETV